MTFPMTLAYAEAYAAARSCLGALADISDFDDSCRCDRLLIDLDGIHGGEFPATYPTPGSWPELLAHLEDEVNRMIELRHRPPDSRRREVCTVASLAASSTTYARKGKTVQFVGLDEAGADRPSRCDGPLSLH